MRVSTLQQAQTSVQTMLEQQSKLSKTEQQIGSGLKLLDPSDDPAGAAQLINMENNLAAIDQYRSNAALADSQLSFQESIYGNLGSTLQRIRELTVQGANGTNSASVLEAIAVEVESRLDEMLSIANSRDVNGDYIFAGYNSSNIPFTREAGGGINYQGDRGARRVQLGEDISLAVQDSGADVFLAVPEGNGNIKVNAEPANTGTLVVKNFSGLDSATMPYTVSFQQATPSDPLTYSVQDSDTPPNTLASGNYERDQALNFAGIQIELSGLPEDGDEVTVAEAGKGNMFATVQNLLDTLQMRPTSDGEKALQSNQFNEALNELDQSISHISSLRTAVGARLNIIDSQATLNEDLELQLRQVISDTRDLDYTEAISRFNNQLVALQAAQQSYARLQQLSLFDFL